MIGAALPRRDGPAKLRGAAPYAYEHEVEHPAYAHLVQATVARGRITGFDLSAAEALDGVLAILTHENAPRLEDTGNAYGLYTSSMDPKWIVNGKAQFNFGRFDDPAVTEALNTYANAASDEDRTAALEVIQKAFADQVPVIPLGAHPLLGEFNTRNYVGWPSEDDLYASADPTQTGIVLVLTKLKPAE